jgi:hypothetical protein
VATAMSSELRWASSWTNAASLANAGEDTSAIVAHLCNPATVPAKPAERRPALPGSDYVSQGVFERGLLTVVEPERTLWDGPGVVSASSSAKVSCR